MRGYHDRLADPEAHGYTPTADDLAPPAPHLVEEYRGLEAFGAEVERVRAENQQTWATDARPDTKDCA